MYLYNSATHKKEEFKTHTPGHVEMYTCGPTVYHFAHIGNLRSYIMEDVLEKYLRYAGYDVNRVMNITDVGHLTSDADEGEDKMLKGAKREHKTVMEIAKYYTDAFFEDCRKLNIKRPDVVQPATGLIDDYIKIITKLIDTGYAYLAGGNVYFDTSKLKRYYIFNDHNEEDLAVGVREGVEEDTNKRNKNDFVLWFTKSKFEDQALKWDSPWGVGYPGWHIECSGISMKYNGEYLDLHCGGVDNAFPHHTNEIAQSESYLGHPWCPHWCHVAHLNTDHGKMSKSKGEFLTVSLLEEKGYEIKVLDLIDMEKSHCYNPFVYISSDDDIQRLTTNLFKNTTPKGSQTQDPFWDQTAAMLLKALVCYLHYEAPPDEQNFSMVMEMIRAGAVKEDNEEYQSVLDELFERLEERNPEHIALKYYRAYHSGSAKTLKSIQISLVSRLEKFNLDSLAGITQCDEMDLGQIGEKKTAVFAVIPDNDSSFNFIVGMLYTQLFQQLYYQADSVHGGRLPVHVHFVMDEFANVALPDEFDKLLSTMRSREISVSIIIQNLAQLKALFEKQWESIVGNCDEFLYLGGNEQSTHEYVSKLLGKETIDTNTYGRSRGRNGSYSTNYQLAGRELMTPDEVRMLDNRYALLFIRGERPIRDLKYDILHHPNVALTMDGSAPAYTHGEDTRSIASMAFSFDQKAVKNAEKLEAEKHEFLLYSEEELEELLDEKEKKDNEET